MVGSVEFLIILAILYLVECVRKVRPDEFIFDRLLSRYCIRKPILYPTNGTWGWMVLNPLRPDAPIYSVKPSQYWITSFGVLTSNGSDTQEIRLFSFKAVGGGTVKESRILVGQAQIDCRSHKDATDLVKFAHALVETALHQRLPEVARMISQSLNTAEIVTVATALNYHTYWLRLANLSLFGICFLAFPLLLATIGLSASLLSVIPMVIPLAVANAVLYRNAAAIIKPSIPKIEIYGNMAKFAFYPVSALRSIEHISYGLLWERDPIAVTAVLCGEEDAARLAKRELAVLRYGLIRSSGESDILGALQEYRESRYRALLQFCRTNKIRVANWDRPPIAESVECKTYCPACGTQYTLPDGACLDCRNIELQSLSYGERPGRKRRTRRQKQ